MRARIWSRGRIGVLAAGLVLAGVGPACVTSEQEDADLDELVVTPSSLTLKVGETASLSVRAFDENDNDVTAGTVFDWGSNDPSVTVSSPGQLVTATGIHEGGAAIIRVRVRGRTEPEGMAFAYVSPVDAIQVTPNPVVLDAGATITVTAVPTVDNREVDVPVTWSLSASVITIARLNNRQIRVTGIQPGNSTLTATAGSRSSAPVPVEVKGAPVPPSFLEGYFMNHDGTRGLGGVTINLGVIPARPVTAEDGFYRAEVTPGGDITVFARGVCDKAHPLCDHELSLNESAVEMAQAAAGTTTRFDLTAQRGRHLRITGGAADLSVAPGAMFPLELEYHTWNNVECPGCAAWLVPGIEGTPGPVHLIGVAGPYSNQDPARATGKTNLMLTAPALTPPNTVQTFGVFVLRAAVSTGQEATNRYLDLWPNASQFIRVFTLKVCAAAPNCP